MTGSTPRPAALLESAGSPTRCRGPNDIGVLASRSAVTSPSIKLAERIDAVKQRLRQTANLRTDPNSRRICLRQPLLGREKFALLSRPSAHTSLRPNSVIMESTSRFPSPRQFAKEKPSLATVNPVDRHPSSSEHAPATDDSCPSPLPEASGDVPNAAESLLEEEPERLCVPEEQPVSASTRVAPRATRPFTP